MLPVGNKEVRAGEKEEQLLQYPKPEACGHDRKPLQPSLREQDGTRDEKSDVADRSDCE